MGQESQLDESRPDASLPQARHQEAVHQQEDGAVPEQEEGVRIVRDVWIHGRFNQQFLSETHDLIIPNFESLFATYIKNPIIMTNILINFIMIRNSALV